ncbi:outer membrane beta-barrel protein [Marivirga tractuosa]|uniref:outer membrane beta-barrel protein n=1 Tax=Marivirga tractuosa TaxID=1006 RepID=UPI0035CFABC2
MRFKILFFFILIYSSVAIAQYNAGGTQFYIGPRASINVANYTAGKNLQGVPQSNGSPIGFGGGFMYKFKVTDFISLHGELNYVKKTRSVMDSTIETKFNNYHLDAPILFEISFPAKNKMIGKFEYFFNVGGQISYWLNGRGETSITNDTENLSASYKIDFNRDTNQSNDPNELNRFQYGFIFGTGLTLPSVGDNYFVIEARYYFCQTFLGGKYSTEVGDLTYEDDLRGNYQIVSLSLAYTFGLNFMPNSQKKSGTKVKTVVK